MNKNTFNDFLTVIYRTRQSFHTSHTKKGDTVVPNSVACFICYSILIYLCCCQGLRCIRGFNWFQLYFLKNNCDIYEIKKAVERSCKLFQTVTFFSKILSCMNNLMHELTVLIEVFYIKLATTQCAIQHTL